MVSFKCHGYYSSLFVRTSFCVLNTEEEAPELTINSCPQLYGKYLARLSHDWKPYNSTDRKAVSPTAALYSYIAVGLQMSRHKACRQTSTGVPNPGPTQTFPVAIHGMLQGVSLCRYDHRNVRNCTKVIHFLYIPFLWAYNELRSINVYRLLHNSRFTVCYSSGK